nr:hypothetical protein BaRGS_007627 [Batillaria attramentaria]
MPTYMHRSALSGVEPRAVLKIISVVIVFVIIVVVNGKACSKHLRWLLYELTIKIINVVIIIIIVTIIIVNEKNMRGTSALAALLSPRHFQKRVAGEGR